MVIAIVGFNVTGNVAPVNVKPAPVIDALLTVTGDDPVEVRVTDSVTGVPIGSFPKLRLLLLSERTGFDAAPVPLSVTVVVLPAEELLEMVIDPVAAPATVGSKATCRVTD